MTDAKQRDARRPTPDARRLERGGRARYPDPRADAGRQTLDARRIGRVALRRLGLFSEAPSQACEHSLHMLQVCDYRRNGPFVGHAQEGCDKQVRLQFARGSQSDIDKTSELSIAEPATTFGDVRSDRHRRPPTLRNKPESLRCRKLLCDPVDAMDNNTTYLPNFEFPEVLHSPLVQEKRPRRNVPDNPLASGVSYPYLNANLSATTLASGVWRLASGVWRLASGVSSKALRADPR
jgi:hypothetical protein